MKEDANLWPKACITLLVTPPALLWRGYVFSLLWLWFVVPTFALPALPLWQAVGLPLVVILLTARRPAPDPDETLGEWVRNLLGAAFAAPLLTLLAGWIIWTLGHS